MQCLSINLYTNIQPWSLNPQTRWGRSRPNRRSERPPRRPSWRRPPGGTPWSGWQRPAWSPVTCRWKSLTFFFIINRNIWLCCISISHPFPQSLTWWLTDVRLSMWRQRKYYICFKLLHNRFLLVIKPRRRPLLQLAFSGKNPLWEIIILPWNIELKSWPIGKDYETSGSCHWDI